MALVEFVSSLILGIIIEFTSLLHNFMSNNDNNGTCFYNFPKDLRGFFNFVIVTFCSNSTRKKITIS